MKEVGRVVSACKGKSPDRLLDGSPSSSLIDCVEVQETEIPGVLLLAPPRFADSCGSLCTLFTEKSHQKFGHDWAEVNLSHTKAGVVRGLYFQHPRPRAELISLVAGSLFDVVVDLRPDSEEFGRVITFELSLNAGRFSQIYLPPGMAHGFGTALGPATITCLVSEPCRSEDRQVLAWNDPDLAIEWPGGNPVLSEQDQNGKSFAEVREMLVQ